MGTVQDVPQQLEALGSKKLSFHELAAWPALREVELVYIFKTVLQTVAVALAGIGFVVKVLGTWARIWLSNCPRAMLSPESAA
jgi:hypothetical protein